MSTAQPPDLPPARPADLPPARPLDLPPARPPYDAPVVASRSGHFWVGTEPESPQRGRGPMHVYWEAAAEVTKPYPIVLIHGGGGQGLDYLTTPDGRPGWCTLLVQQGWVVYVVDRPGHGRSPYRPAEMGEPGPPPPPGLVESIFVPKTTGPFGVPSADLHTQWPGDRDDPDDVMLRRFLAAGGPFAGDHVDRQSLERDRLAELLDLVGPAFVVSNSMGGPSGYLVADARPHLVKALLQAEPVGPPFGQQLGPECLQWGVTGAPVAYDPPAASAADLQLEHREVPPGTPPVVLQAEPARRLVNLSQVPIAVLSGEASPFRYTDPIVVEFLKQAGCDAVHLDLGSLGVHGNAHGVMLERNNAEVLAVVTDWFEQHLG